MEEEPQQAVAPRRHSASGASGRRKWEARAVRQEEAARTSITELRSDGVQTQRAMRMRELMQHIERLVAPEGGPRPLRRRGTSTEFSARSRNNAVHVRDLRAIDGTYSCENPSVVVRQHVIIVNLNPFRAVIAFDRIMIFCADDDLVESIARQLDRISTEFIPRRDDEPEDEKSDLDTSQARSPRSERRYWLTPKAQDDYDDGGYVPFELRALEAMLTVAVRRLEAEADSLMPAVKESTLCMQSNRMSVDLLERLRRIKNAVSFQETRARDTTEAIRAILDDDDDMCMTKLSLMREKPDLFVAPMEAEFVMDHDDVELLLESNLQATEAVQTKLELLRQSIDNSEDS